MSHWNIVDVIRWHTTLEPHERVQFFGLLEKTTHEYDIQYSSLLYGKVTRFSSYLCRARATYFSGVFFKSENETIFVFLDRESP